MRQGQGLAWAAPGSAAGGWGRVVHVAHHQQGVRNSTLPLQQPRSLKWQMIFLFFSIFGIVDASQMSWKGNFVHSTNFGFKGGRLEEGAPSH